MNLYDNIVLNADKHPNNIAFFSNATQISYKELHIKLLKFQKLYSGIYKKDDIVILRYCDPITFLICFLGLLSIQCWVLLLPRDIDPSFERKISSKKARKFSFEKFATINDIKLNTKYIEICIPDENKCGIFHPTSGSSFTPKLCIRTLKALTNEGLQYKKMLSITSNDRIYSICPINHSFPLGSALMTALVSGASLYTIDTFVPRTCIENIIDYKITILILVPQMAQYLCDVSYKGNLKKHKLRIVLVGAGKITKDLYDNFKKRFGIFLSSNYGSTETGGLLTRNFEDDEISNGILMPGVEIKICDQHGTRLPPGQEGIVYIKSKSMLSNYYPPQSKLFDCEGFFLTNDIAKELPNSRYMLIDRNKNTVNIAGKKINIKEVEKVIESHEKVSECRVFTIEEQGTIKGLVAYIQCKQDIQEEIRAYCSNYLSEYKIPQKIITQKKFLKNEMGKITLLSLNKQN